MISSIFSRPSCQGRSMRAQDAHGDSMRVACAGQWWIAGGRLQRAGKAGRWRTFELRPLLIDDPRSKVITQLVVVERLADGLVIRLKGVRVLSLFENLPGTAWARHGHGMGTAWARYGHVMGTAWRDSQRGSAKRRCGGAGAGVRAPPSGRASSVCPHTDPYPCRPCRLPSCRT